MANLMDLLQGQLSDDMVDRLSQQIGGADRQQTAVAANSIVNVLLSALNKNAQDPGGASSLASALDRDHDGSILDDVIGMISGQVRPQNERMVNGSGIVKHVLGRKTDNVIDMVSRMSGLDKNRSGSLLTMLAPIVMGALGRQKRQQNLDTGGLSGLLNKTVKSQKSQNAQMDLISRFLDQDGDGSVIDDLAGFGMKALGKFFRRK